jgi:sterol carrier protein 2
LTRAIVAGVGMIPFKKPDAANVYVAMGSEAARRALADAGLAYTNIQQAYVGYVYGDSTCGQRALYEIGLSGAPIINVNNNCSTGSTALYLARQAIESGAVDCVLALGFEQMKPARLELSTKTGRAPSPNSTPRRTSSSTRRAFRWRYAISAGPVSRI